VGDHELAAIEHEVTDEPVDERRDARRQLGRRARQLFERLREAMAHRHVAARELLVQLDLVVAGHAQRRARARHVHHQLEHLDDAGPAIDEITQEHRLAAGRRRRRPRGAIDRVAERAEQLDELVDAAVHVADHVERPMVVAPVGPQPRALDRRRVDRLDRVEHADVAKALAAERAERLAQLRRVLAHDVEPELPIGAAAVALVAQSGRQIEHDRDRQAVVLARDRDQRLARVRLHVRRVDHCQPVAGQPLAREEVDDLERVIRRVARALVIGHHPAAGVRRDDLGRRKVRARERRLAAPRRADQDDERAVWNCDLHRTNTPICVGAPSASSTSPIGANRTA
jgi:hypothetical protein